MVEEELVEVVLVVVEIVVGGGVMVSTSSFHVEISIEGISSQLSKGFLKQHNIVFTNLFPIPTY